MSPEDKKQKDVEKLSPLKDIYHSDLGEENKQYFSTLERGKIMERWKKLLIGFFVVLILLASATVAGFIIFQSKEKFTGEHIRLGFSGPESVSSGDSFSVTVTYENNETVALKNAEFTASFPEGYTLEQAVPAPANEFKNTWPLKDIGVGQKGSIIIRGRLVGQDSGAKTISGKLNFEPANFSSPFDVRASYTVRIQESALKLTLDFAPRASAAAEVSGTISLRNESDETLRDIRLEVIFPTDFTIASTEPKATEGARWDIDALSKDKPYQIAVKGTFHGSNGDLKELRAKASIRSDKNEFVTQADTNALISIIDTNLQASLTVNGRSGNFSVDWGETLDIVLKVRNAGDQIIRDAVGSLAVDSTIIDWDKIRWTTPGKRDKTKIIWTKTEFSDLAEIAPNAETTLAVSVPIIERPPQSVSSTDLMIRITGDIVSTNVVDLEGETIRTSTPPLEIRVTTQVQLRPEARFVDDEYQPVGSGPVPPEVGKTTTYQISWYVSNASNEVTDVKVLTTLPAGVFWVGKEEVSSGSIVFDPLTRQVVWTMNRVPARSGLDLPGLSAAFSVSVTPTAADVGNSLNLTDQTSLEAVDSFTKQIIQKRFDVLTTDIPADPANAGKGKVVASTSVNANTNSNENTNQ